MSNTPCDYPTAPEDVQLMVEGRAAAASGRGQQVREAARMSRSGMARLLGVSKTSLLRWESGETLPYGAHAVEYARLLRQFAVEVSVHG